MVRVSSRVLILSILSLLISLGVGIGIGHVVKANQIDDLNSDIDKYEEQLSVIQFEAENLREEALVMASDLEEIQADYDLLLAKQSSNLEKLQTCQEDNVSLSEGYQSLQEEIEDLREASNAATVEELIRLRELVFSLERLNSQMNIEIAQLTKQVTPSPDHAVRGSDIWGNPYFRSSAWEGRDYELQLKLEEIAQLYHRTHTYIPGETDCSDMAVDIWNMLLTEEIRSVIVVGSLEKVSEPVEESDHAWLYVFDAGGKVIYMETTTGMVLYGLLPDGSRNPEVIPYRDGFVYEKPSDLWKDLKKLLYQ